MTAIVLTGIKVRTATVRILDFGMLLTPPLGGPVQRINRLGNRYAIDIEVPPMKEEPDGRRFTVLLERALANGAAFPVPQTDLRIPPAGAPLVNGAVASGSTLPLRGLTPNFMFRAGQYLSISHSGRRYLHRVTAEAFADGAGVASVTLTPMLRTPLSDGDAVEVERPLIEGWIQAPSWELMTAPFTSVRFTISEGA